MKRILLLLLLSTAAFAASTKHEDTVIVPSLKGLVFVSSSKDIQKTPLLTEGISVSGVSMLNHAELEPELTSYIGQPLTFKGLNEITSRVLAFYKEQNHSLVDVVAPEQDVSTGVIQILVSEFRVGEVRVQGNRWFSDKVVTRPVTFQHGDAVDTQKLLNEVDADNANPFRRVDLVYQPSSQPGFTDLVLNTQDRFPVNAYSGFDNSGTAATGRSRWNVGGTWGNALGHDQQITYQLSSSDDFRSFVSNSLTWIMPIHQRDSISISGSFQRSVPNIGNDFGLVGKSGQASIRYSLALHRTDRFIQTVQFGYDFKTTNNNLAFGGTQVSRNTTEIDQFPVGYSANLTDHMGSSSFTTDIVFSPGGLSPNNHSSDFQPSYSQTGILGAMSRYTYWRGDFTRLSRLPKDAVYAFRLIGQTSSTNLLYTEKLSAGGPDLMRGYDPNSVYGDRGIVTSNELRTPALKPFPEQGLGAAQLFVFWDYGHLVAANAFAGATNSVNASSVGAGVRYDMRNNLAANVSYGRALIQLPNANSAARNNFTNLGLTLSY